MLVCIYKQKLFLSKSITFYKHCGKGILKITLPIKRKLGKIDEKVLPIFFRKEEK